MTYTLRDIPDVLWRQIQLNAEASGLTIRKYILLALEHHNVKFKILDPADESIDRANSSIQLAKGSDAKRFDKR
jgi:hypothetical protein